MTTSENQIGARVVWTGDVSKYDKTYKDEIYFSYRAVKSDNHLLIEEKRCDALGNDIWVIENNKQVLQDILTNIIFDFSDQKSKFDSEKNFVLFVIDLIDLQRQYLSLPSRVYFRLVFMAKNKSFICERKTKDSLGNDFWIEDPDIISIMSYYILQNIVLDLAD